MSAWISMISDADADDDLLDALKLARTPHGTVDNVMRCLLYTSPSPRD